jgi:hypothetical protein
VDSGGPCGPWLTPSRDLDPGSCRITLSCEQILTAPVSRCVFPHVLEKRVVPDLSTVLQCVNTAPCQCVVGTSFDH